jgi:anionic cell wall polymer biosynthesis LytR-Cps2A-Psr (LCP) family protein
MRRPQQVLLAMREKAFQISPTTEIFDLWPNVANMIETNLQPADIVQLVQLAAEVDREKIQTIVIDGDYAVDYVAESGAQILLPLPARIKEAVGELLPVYPATVAPFGSNEQYAIPGSPGRPKEANRDQ